MQSASRNRASESRRCSWSKPHSLTSPTAAAVTICPRSAALESQFYAAQESNGHRASLHLAIFALVLFDLSLSTMMRFVYRQRQQQPQASLSSDAKSTG